MTTLPITHMTLYKHGVGFFERRGQLAGEAVTLSFRVDEMNDILKSLTAIDYGPGQVLGIDYATPQSREERLAGNSIRLDDRRSMQDLIICLRGRAVELLLDQGEQMAGTLIGLDEVTKEQPLATALVSLLRTDSAQVQTVSLSRVQGVHIQDDQAAGDLRFFLNTALTQDEFRPVTVRLDAGEHDLSVSYVAPAPTWRVSYRIVADPETDGSPGALLLGWGIFDNRLEEDLEDISLALVAGMPISFVYELYTPFTPDRPVVEEEARVAPGPVAFEGMVAEPALEAIAAPSMAMAAAPRGRGISREAMRAETVAQAAGVEMGELFQYQITTPVSVGRGQSAMVPILNVDLSYRKELLYNGQKMPEHPVAALRFENQTGLTLERGPVVVIENGEYVGEAVLPFTAEDAEFNVPYAVELGVKVQEQSSAGREIASLQIRGEFLVVEEWDIRRMEYQLNNKTNVAKTVLVEHPRQREYALYATSEPAEQTGTHWRFAVPVAGGGEETLLVQQRRLISRREQLQKQSYAGLQRYLRQGLLSREVYEQVMELLRLWEQIGELEQRQGEIEKERQQIYQAQQQIQGNMTALEKSGREGALRTRYVDQLEQQEEQLRSLSDEAQQKKVEVERIKQQIAEKLAAL